MTIIWIQLIRQIRANLSGDALNPDKIPAVLDVVVALAEGGYPFFWIWLSLNEADSVGEIR